MIFSRMLEPRDVQQEWPLQTKLSGHHLLRSFGVCREKSLMLNSIVNHRGSGAWQFEKGADVSRRVFANGNDCILTPRQSARHHPSVKHSLPIVLARHLEGRQVMDRGHQPAGPRPEQASIAWHVQ